MSVHFPDGAQRPDAGIHCQTCSLSAICLPLALKMEDMDEFDAIIRRRAPLVRGETLCRQGDTFSQVFVVRTGSFKQVVLDEEGEEQITHFHLPGELMGLEGINENVQPGFLIALERSTVCEIPFHQLDALAERLPGLRNELYRSMSRHMGEDHHLIRLLNCKSADERLASFLLDLARRFQRNGHSPKNFRLPMSRTDIGNYLGLALETVSRMLGRLQQQSLIELKGRELHILQPEALYQFSESHPCLGHALNRQKG
ncbi:fumarate/nitrate reduction transcriptional regulator Fnr [Kushneria phosphatilytica]|uniref:Fumarate/nitrate reduction transcriptional regulator Fnr n=1 Tax=Kushneria phosphatilytica TaxID=657387 RepID=A0A1S1NU05_9GAMM|nr:fumarate/nitrate reduction transcriptional regulator Fnr [Kushneria phosphatilytica]OHV09689.1 Crp/Fnr family transcriptional regulator [Kushneria phosphatilytica]QEL11736.1 fumarate/nitrate reduction transcriptional regulator Fnr [Kushneria phosphatilytica]